MKLPSIPLVLNSLSLSESILPSELIEHNLNPEQYQFFIDLKTEYLVKIGSLLAVLKGCKRSTFVRDYLEIEYTDWLDRYLEFEREQREKVGWRLLRSARRAIADEQERALFEENHSIIP